MLRSLDAVGEFTSEKPVTRRYSAPGEELSVLPARQVMEQQQDQIASGARHRPRLRREWWKLVYLGIIILVVTAFRSSILDWNDVMTGSMAPTILPGDRFLVNKTAYGLMIPFTERYLVEWSDGPQRGDIVAFKATVDGEDLRMIKRIVGLPGDLIAYRRGQLTINGRQVQYAPLPESMQITYSPYDPWEHTTALELLDGRPHPILHTPAAVGTSFFPTRIPPDHYFVMGDNRDNSEDSRSIGFIPRKNIIGRVTHVVFSLDPERGFKPRENRTWDRLP